MPISEPTMVRRQLGRKLRELRKQAGKGEKDVAEAKLASRPKLWRIETGKAPISVGDVLALCRLYGADPETTNALADLANETRNGKGMWEDFADALPDWLGLYMGLEASAETIQIYDPELVPGLLQTPDYARALFEAGANPLDKDAVQLRIDLRHKRLQVLLQREPKLRFSTILNAALLARPVGGIEVMREQLDRLIELSDVDNIDIRVLPLEIGAHAAMHIGAFTIMTFSDPKDPTIVYIETHIGATYREAAEEVAEYSKVYDLLDEKTVPIKEYRQ
jgi:transcriptional regulator with XRE-family HTH domain